jgi:hypothetical protein
MAKRMPDHEKAIRERARRMWRDDGSPAGRFDEYLERARELQAVIDNPAAGQMPNPMVVHHGEIKPEQPVEEAEIQENLGEFPSMYSDQGDHLEAPMTRKKARRARREG